MKVINILFQQKVRSNKSTENNRDFTENQTAKNENDTKKLGDYIEYEEVK